MGFISKFISDTVSEMKLSSAEKKERAEQERKEQEYILSFATEVPEEAKKLTLKDRVKTIKEQDRKTLLVEAGIVFVLIDTVISIFRLLMFFITLSYGYLWTSMLYIIPAGILPFVAWLYSTDITAFNYHRRKYAILTVCVVHYISLMIQPLINFSAHVIFPHLTRIVISKYFSKTMVLWLGRLTVAVLPIAAMSVIVVAFGSTYFSDTFYDTVAQFKLSHIIDDRKYKDTAYDLTIFNDLKTGEPITIREQDRFMHSLALGATGTGKTSMACLTAVANDLDRRCENEDTRNKLLLEMVAQHKAFIHIPEGEDPSEFKVSYVVPREEYEKEYKEILKRYRGCGIILLAPDEAACNSAMDLAIARGFKPKMLDPTVLDDPELTLKYGDYLYGLNPLFSPVSDEENFDLDREAIYVTAAAKNFSDVLDAIDALHGKSGDRFFTSVNRNLTRNIAAVIILYYTHDKKRQATIDDFQIHLQDFATLDQVMKTLERLYGNRALTKEGELSHCTLDKTAWRATFANVYNELLQADRAKENNSYAYGLRNIIDEFIADPRIKRIFTTGANDMSGKMVINFDKSLEDGDIIICNYALNVGENTAVGFGNFFQLSLNLAVFKRRLNEPDLLVPVFEHCDETSVLAAAGWLERALALFRKYKVGFSGYLQSLDQMNKSETTKYLKNLFLGVGTHIIYGRASVEDMEIYSKLSGADMTDVIQTNINETSVWDDANYSYGERTSTQEMVNVSETQIRYRDFQELTLMTVQGGRVLKAIAARGHFLPKEAYEPRKRFVIDIDKVMSEFPESDLDRAYYEEIAKIQEQLERDAADEKDRVLAKLGIGMTDTTVITHITKGETKGETEPAEPVEPAEPQKPEESTGSEKTEEPPTGQDDNSKKSSGLFSPEELAGMGDDPESDGAAF